MTFFIFSKFVKFVYNDELIYFYVVKCHLINLNGKADGRFKLKQIFLVQMRILDNVTDLIKNKKKRLLK